MSKDSNTQHRAPRHHPPTKIIVERHYAGTGKNGNAIQADSRGTDNKKG